MSTTAGGGAAASSEDAPTFENARYELFMRHMDAWTFGTVMRDCKIPDAHERSGGRAGEVPYFHGMAQEALGHQRGGSGGRREPRRRIWFSQKGRSQRQIRVGPALFDARGCAGQIPTSGDVLVGEAVANDGNRRGYRFRYWHADARPLFELRRLFEHGTRSAERRHRRTLRTYRYPSDDDDDDDDRPQGCDDLFALVSLVLYGNVKRFVEQHRGHTEQAERLVFHDAPHMHCAQFVYDVATNYGEPGLWQRFLADVPDAAEHIITRPPDRKRRRRMDVDEDDDDDSTAPRVAPLTRRRAPDPPVDDYRQAEDEEYLLPTRSSTARPATSWGAALAPAPAAPPTTSSWSLAPPPPQPPTASSVEPPQDDIMRMLDALNSADTDLVAGAGDVPPPPPPPANNNNNDDVDIYADLGVPGPAATSEPASEPDATDIYATLMSATAESPPPPPSPEVPAGWWDEEGAQVDWRFVESMPVTDAGGAARLRFRYVAEGGTTLECDIAPETAKKKYPPQWVRKAVRLPRLRACAAIVRMTVRQLDGGATGTLDVV